MTFIFNRANDITRTGDCTKFDNIWTVGTNPVTVGKSTNSSFDLDL